MTATPRLIWQSQDDAFRLVIVERSLVPLAYQVNISSSEDMVLEQLVERDCLGRDVWQKVKNDGNPWLRAFYRLASDTGLFGGADVSDQVRQLLEGGGRSPC